MIFPIGDDDSQVDLAPVVTVAIVALNVLVFLYQMTLPAASLQQFMLAYSTIPREISTGRDLPPTIPVPVYVTLLTAMFMHGGLMHILGNMVYLWVFGNNIEGALGHVRYLSFYLACGVLAGLTHVTLNPSSTIPSLGASGAISGVLGAYLVMFPKGRVKILVGRMITETSAWVALGGWIALQLLSVALSPRNQGGGGVAFWAHIGGFFAGMILGPVMRRR
ncbi:MAG TPA: rhomboid family intramembrane serine protease [Acidobacteriota bacterium]